MAIINRLLQKCQIYNIDQRKISFIIAHFDIYLDNFISFAFKFSISEFFPLQPTLKFIADYLDFLRIYWLKYFLCKYTQIAGRPVCEYRFLSSRLQWRSLFKIELAKIKWGARLKCCYVANLSMVSKQVRRRLLAVMRDPSAAQSSFPFPFFAQHFFSHTKIRDGSNMNELVISALVNTSGHIGITRKTN